MPYSTSPRETIADGVLHVTGLLVALPAVVWLVMHTDQKIATLLYATMLIGSLAASALYHLSPIDRTRAAFGRLDHAMIYFKIAGTYTPLVAVIGTTLAYGIAAAVWALALVGAVAKLRGWDTQSRGSLALYLAMGWLSVFLLQAMWLHLPHLAVLFVIAGGALYSLGTIIFARDTMRYQNAIWHIFVLSASVCFFLAIALSV